ncbi:acyltransferase family protein [Ectopseudomonas guguanensis]|uniref:acyltransferase family protein n=1 Tax=Ectopseudomonas guguanensis TaxID=1198456 RepID=UPI0039C02266
MQRIENIRPESFANISLLRAIAALMVVYDHLFCIVPLRHFGVAAFPAPLVQEYISTPLGIIQDFGWMGVAIFFLVSGFIISHVAMRENRAEFIVKRVFRIYPPLILAVLIACVASFITSGKTFTLGQVLSAFTLTNYWTYPQVPVLGVAWTLAIEILFYVLTFILLPILKKNPIIAISIQLSVVFVIYGLRKDFGHGFFLFSASAAYLPYLIIGQITYFLYARIITPGAFFILLTVAYAAVLVGIHLIHTAFIRVDNSYLINFMYAYFVFIIFLVFKDRFRVAPFMQFLADSSYSLYLLHGSVGITAIVLISKYIESNSEFVVLATSLFAAALSIFASWLFFRLVERPSIKLARSTCRAINMNFLRERRD